MSFDPNELTAIELFAGIGGFRLAAEDFGIKTIWANDIDPYASKVYRDKFGEDNFFEGDIWKLLDKIPKHDLLTGGFPCQPFSSAGKKKGIEDPRGTLFEAIVKVLKKNQPSYFILENVKRLLSMDNGLHFATILKSLAELDYRIEWRLLNAMDLSLPQNRQRVVLLGIHDKKIKGKKNSETQLDLARLVSSQELAHFSAEEKIQLANPNEWIQIEDNKSSFPNWGIAYKGRFFASEIRSFKDKKPSVFLRDVIENKTEAIFDLTETTKKWIKNNRPVGKFVGGVEIISNQRGGARMGYTIFGTNGVAPTLTSSTSRHYERYKIGDKYRRLTPGEYARIQGFPLNHCSAAPMREQYVLFGNAVPPALIKWVLSKLFAKSGPIELESVLPLPLIEYEGQRKVKTNSQR